jgi:hypothetical protein
MFIFALSSITDSTLEIREVTATTFSSMSDPKSIVEMAIETFPDRFGEELDFLEWEAFKTLLLNNMDYLIEYKEI